MTTKKKTKTETKEKKLSPFLSNPITTAYARQLVKNYKENKLYPGDTQGVWYEREIFEKLLKDKSVTGFRFYFGAYGKESDYKANNKSLKFEPPYEKTTIVIVPTSKKIIPGGNTTISREHSTDTKDIYEDFLDNPTAIPSYPLPGSDFFKEQNDGQHSPPPPLGGNSTSNDLLNGI